MVVCSPACAQQVKTDRVTLASMAEKALRSHRLLATFCFCMATVSILLALLSAVGDWFLAAYLGSAGVIFAVAGVRSKRLSERGDA